MRILLSENYNIEYYKKLQTIKIDIGELGLFKNYQNIPILFIRQVFSIALKDG